MMSLQRVYTRSGVPLAPLVVAPSLIVKSGNQQPMLKRLAPTWCKETLARRRQTSLEQVFGTGLWASYTFVHL